MKGTWVSHQAGSHPMQRSDAEWEGWHYTEVQKWLTEFIAGCGSEFFPQKFENGRQVLQTGWGSCVETVDRSSFWAATCWITWSYSRNAWDGSWVVWISQIPWILLRFSETGSFCKAFWKEVSLTQWLIYLDDNTALTEKSWCYNFAKQPSLIFTSSLFPEMQT